ncbi:hypothetical protein P7D22_02615 [Lichenihabitans sp. Uapishka_5]|uniref:hypothetical protein n=1 Tax=Lichenihabitans sp. Uapishka_5 TaxID=3037302 RepID=UPI0029E812F9|nr:hypothetical protein [Lichenihabitans sp. Uapishka_5]MDX7950068.1 hypothetical protein [Lichenihabitans sp. Uapishka_5]
MRVRFVTAMLAVTASLWLAGCAGPNGERPALDNAVVRPSSSNYGFSGGYVGTTNGGFR